MSRIRIRIPRLLATSLGAMLFISCTNPQWMCGCSPAEPVAFVSGRVTGPDGAGVAGARVRAEVAEPGCAEPFRLSGEVMTEADGSYGTYIHYGYTRAAPGDCVKVYADPPAAGAFSPSDTARVDLLFSLDGQLDSARVDLVLRAR